MILTYGKRSFWVNPNLVRIVCREAVTLSPDGVEEMTVVIFDDDHRLFVKESFASVVHMLRHNTSPVMYAPSSEVPA